MMRVTGLVLIGLLASLGCKDSEAVPDASDAAAEPPAPLELVPDGDIADTRFGRAVAISGDTILVAAEHGYGATLPPRGGVVFVFVRDEMDWSQQAELTVDDVESFGSSVALSGDTALVGARTADGNVARTGAAYVFVRNGTAWSQEAKLVADDGADLDYFGWSVATVGDIAVVGAPRDRQSGAAYVFERSGAAWSQAARLEGESRPDPWDEFGHAVAMTPDVIAVGAPRLGGSAYLFTRSGAQWNQRTKLSGLDGKPTARFGQSVAVSGDIALVGAAKPESVRDGAYVFTGAGSTWTEQAVLLADDTPDTPDLGQSVALAENEALVGGFNDREGPHAVARFVGNGGAWALAPSLRVPLSSEAHLGFSLGATGGTVVVGALYYEVGADESFPGSAYVFELP